MGRVEHEPLERSIDHLLEECRMVLPGVQALFGFQLVAVFSQPFFQLLAEREQRLHLAALFLTAISVAMLMAPAAYHRQVEPRTVSERFLHYAGALLTGAMVPLMVGLSVDVYIIAMLILGSPALGATVAGVLFAVYGVLWFVMPWARRSSSPAAG